MKFKPCGQRILVEDIVEKYDGLLQLPPSSKERGEKPTFQSIVIAVSEEIVDPKIKVDDVICRGEFIGQILDVKLRHRVMNVADALGKME